MLFNSLEFYLFLPLVFTLYWIFENKLYRDGVLLVASYVFYGWWDWRFLSLIIASSLVDYVIGQKLVTSKFKKGWLSLSVLFNLGLLGFFKYHNFFVSSFVEALDSVGISLSIVTIDIVLPVGISFYTFQTLSYTIDIYRGKLKPTKDIIAFFTFVSFFPQLVAGPIERAKHLLPQFYRKHTFSYPLAVEGARLILWGLFKKVVIADNLAYDVDHIFSSYESLSSWVLYEGLVFFAFQIYCDFSGYSDIARGVSRWFGFDIMRNFNRPYISTSFREFWSRWHISLSTWFRDYVYIPLGGNKRGLYFHIRNLSLTFLLSGLWHGANWTFVFWGVLHVLFYIPETLFRNSKIKAFVKNRWIKQLAVFNMIVLAWAFFRAPTIDDAFSYTFNMLTGILLHPGSIVFAQYYFSVLLVPLLLLLEWKMGDNEHPFEINNTYVRWICYIIVTILILWYQSYHSTTSFIYFQF